MNNKYTIMVIATIFMFVVVPLAYTALINPISRPGSGSVRSIGVEIYADPEMTIVLDELAYGMIDPGDSGVITGYVRNIGNHAVTLSFWTDTWTPSAASTYIAITTDYDGSVIAKDEAIIVDFTCTVDINVDGIEGFTFTEWVLATKV